MLNRRLWNRRQKSTGKDGNQQGTTFRSRLIPLSADKNLPPFVIDVDNPSANPSASNLWNPPSNFAIDADDRDKTYKTVKYCLSLVGVDGGAFYQRAKADLKDSDSDWIYEDGCLICTDDLDVARACLLACTDKKKLYCQDCVKVLQEKADQVGRVSCPFCRRQVYFINTQWVIANNEEKRRSAISARKKRKRKQKKSAKRKKLAEQKKAAVQKKPEPDEVSIIEITDDEGGAVIDGEVLEISDDDS
ncbi:hypothetical protein E1B28_008477 [Marasmius oreades]|uniref:RING-type domain-containing protein n=1 Tax=Marasmius oreades TaxID=181124 RepID=A0A9P7UTC0_9AGAR|nr:uncharacterized protein E1B28_008477 [Marasmius oreades]KAG7092101.1 hypothetical protein E1B28_008477 [Marasmius oreades]